MSVIKIAVGDRVLLKKNHACGSNSFIVTRVGSDIKITCSACSRDLVMSRDKFEHALKKTIINGDNK